MSTSRGKEKINFEPGNTSHCCFNPSWANGDEKDEQEPLLVVFPSIHSNLTNAIIENVKEALGKVVSGWEPLGHCGNKRQYLKDLSTNKNMTHLKHRWKQYSIQW